MSRKNLKLNFVALLTGLALLMTALGCESGSVMGPMSRPMRGRFPRNPALARIRRTKGRLTSLPYGKAGAELGQHATRVT